MSTLTLSLNYKRPVQSVGVSANTLTFATVHNLAVGDPFSLTSTGSVPGGCAGTLYVGAGSTTTVINPATSSGSLIDITDAGSGVISLVNSYSVQISRFLDDGYNRVWANFTNQETSANGAVSIRKRLYKRLIWTITCALQWADVQTLQAMLEAADANWDLSAEDGSLVLADLIEPFTEIGARTRALAPGASEVIGNGKTSYYGQFKVQLTDLDTPRLSDQSTDTDRWYRCRFVLNELEVVAA